MSLTAEQIQVRRLARLTGHQAPIYGLTAGARPGEWYSGGGDHWLVQWNADKPDEGHLVAKAEAQVFALLYLAHAQILLAGTMLGGLHWIHLAHPELSKHVAHHKKGLFGLVAVGSHIFSIGGDGVLTRWNLSEQRSEESLQLSHQSLRCIAYSPARKELAIGASDHHIYLVDVSTLSLRQEIHRAHNNSVFSLAYHPHKDLLISGGRDAHLKVWDLGAHAKMISDQPGHWYTINDIVFNPESTIFATASRDKTIKLWESDQFRLCKVIDTARFGGHTHSVNRLCWESPNTLLSASDDKTLMQWDIQL